MEKTICSQSLPDVYFARYLRPDPFNDWGGREGCNKFVPVLVGDGTKKTLSGTCLTNPLVE